MAYITVTSTKELDAQGIRDMVWSGAKDRVEDLTDKQLDIIIDILADLYPDGIDETELNDFLWFNDDTYAEWLGYRDAEQMWEHVGEDGDYLINKKVRVDFFDNPQFSTSESLADQLDSIIDIDVDYDYIHDEDETYDAETDTYGGSVVVDISQAGMDKLAEANVEFELVEE